MRFPLSFTLSAVALAAAAPADAATILLNAGFEDGSLANWNASGAVLSNAQARTGLYSASAFGSDSIRQNFAAIATSQITEVSFWILRADGPFSSYRFLYSDNTTGFFLANGIGTSGWRFFNVTANLAANKNLVGFEIFGTTPGPAYLDDFTINVGAIPEPASWAMMISGFGLIGAAARRRPRVTMSYAAG